MTTSHIKPIGRRPLRLGFLLIPLALAWLALSPQARAVCQEGCLTNQNTVLGDDALLNNTTGFNNTAIGFNALLNNTTGFNNTANGWHALFNNTTGDYNTASGALALLSNTTGAANTASGVAALQGNTSGNNNTANGFAALVSNTTGIGNTAVGVQALLSNTTGGGNTANGSFALESNTTGFNNTATGNVALFFNTTGSNNTATGFAALQGNNSTGFNNTATGVSALTSNTTGSYNTASGQGSLLSNTTGRNNTANGQNAMRSNTTGSFNIAIGSNAGFNLTTGSNNIDIFDRGVAGEANTIRIGRQETQTTTFIAGISGATVTGTAVVVNSSGQLGVAPSSQRFKQNIQTMGDASDILLALRPVTFEYKPDVDPKGIPQFGLVAEEVEKVNPALVARDADGKPYTVRYEAVNAMLLNEFLKEHRTVQEQQKEIDALRAELKEQRALIQMVNDKVELNRAAPQTVLNDQ